MDDLRYWIGFNRVSGIGPARLRALLDEFGDLEKAWGAPQAELLEAGLDRRTLANLTEARSSLDLGRELARIQQEGISILTWNDAAYPALLRQIEGSPPVLYVRGSMEDSDDWALAVVGTRSASAYGKEATRRLVIPLAEMGVTIVSGMALGIDAEAHRAALEAGGRTIAVLGCGLDTVYPAEHRRLAETIRQRGALISEYPLGTVPDRRNFPPRNRLISGLARGVLVIEAGPKSGALITARFAAEQGRDVFAVPGSILTRRQVGTNQLITNGAIPVMSSEDILRELQLEMLPLKRQTRQVFLTTNEERQLLDCLSEEPMHIDQIARVLSLPISQVSSTLTLLELKGYVRHAGGMHYARA